MPIAKKPRKLAIEELYEYAVKSLAARAQSVSDLGAKLKRRAAHLGDVDAIVARLKDVGYLDDARFADSFAAWRAGNEGFGRTRLLVDLAAHRVPRELAQEAVEKALEGRTEAEQIDAFIERRMASADFSDEKGLARAFRKLRRAGFATGPVFAALKRVAAKPEMVEEFPDEEEEVDL
jgi:regulatory protein